MTILGIIPARYASTRFPGKPLCLINGKTMIQRVYEQAKKCRSLSQVVVATDHELIEQHVRSFGGTAVMTSDTHSSGTERCAEALKKIMAQPEGNLADIVVNIQGDEPYIQPEQMEEVVRCFRDPTTVIATLARKIQDPADLTDPNVVKVVFDNMQQALYFSRSMIPYVRTGNPESFLQEGNFFAHIGIYGYLASTLKELVSLPVSSLEQAESLEQLRWLQHGFPITVRETTYTGIAIDTPEDLRKIPGHTR